MAAQTFAHMAAFVEPFCVKPGSAVGLVEDFDPTHTADFIHKKDAADFLKQGIELLAEYQTRLAAQDIHGVLVCLQGLDAGGKDGTISHVMSGVNPQGVEVHGFGAPSDEELDHDYLWRHACKLPARGRIGIFNRSHYEEVLVVRVHPDFLDHERLPDSSKGNDVWARRYREINDWERYLVDNGYAVVKLFLNVSKEEQRRRFLARIDEPEKNWKFSASDARERQYFDEYMKVFSEMLSNTSTEWAPWYVIPADHKWFAHITAAAVLVKTLMDIDPQYPKLSPEERASLMEAKRELEAEAPPGAEPDPIQ